MDLLDAEYKITHVQTVECFSVGGPEVAQTSFRHCSKVQFHLIIGTHVFIDSVLSFVVRVPVCSDPEENEPIHVEEDSNQVEILIEQWIAVISFTDVHLSSLG